MTGLQKIDLTLDVLLRMRERLSNPDNWCQKDLGRGERRCLVGTIDAVMHIEPEQRQPFAQHEDWEAVYKLLHQLSDGEVATFNDAKDTRHEDVLALLDLAIEQRTQSVVI